jgi:signal recognition particle GTPase
VVLQLIKVNQPDLVLFVGEALVGNEAVDQLVKFNQAMADHSSSANPHLIDGIVLTKFDTIDDKVCVRVPIFIYQNLMQSVFSYVNILKLILFNSHSHKTLLWD